MTGVGTSSINTTAMRAIRKSVMNALTAIRLEDQKSVALGFQAGASLVSPHATFNQVHLIIDARAF